MDADTSIEECNRISENGDLTGVHTAKNKGLRGSKWIIADKILEEYEKVCVNTSNFSSLHLAAKLTFGMRTFKKTLRQTTSDKIDAFDAYGYTALHWAANAGSAIKIQLLLDNKADVNVQDQIQGKTALHLALLKRWESAAEQLLQCDRVDVNIQEKNRWTALHQAALWKNVPTDLFKTIIDKSSNVNAKSILGRTALHLALRKKSATAAKELLNYNKNGQRVDVNITDGLGKTALHYAAGWPNIPVGLFKEILRNSADVNAIEKMEESTALHFALEKQSITATAHLLGHPDINLNIKNKKHFLPFRFAVEWRDIPPHLFSIMLKKISNAREKTGEQVALHSEVDAKTDIAINPLTKDEKADVTKEDNENCTATPATVDVTANQSRLLDDELPRLHATSGPERPVEQDVSLEIDSELKLNDSNDLLVTTYEDELDDTSHQGVINQLELKKNTFAKKESELRRLCARDVSMDLTAKIKTLIDLGINVNATDKYGRNALHFLCRNNSSPNLTDAIRLLIQHGINVNAANKFGQNALHCLCQKNSSSNLIDAIQMLFQFELEVNAKDKVGWSALHYLCVYKSTSNLIKATKILIKQGIDVNAKSTNGRNALHYLCFYNSGSNLIGAVQILIEHGISVTSDGHDARSILREHYRKSDKEDIIKLMDDAVLAQS
ncbi:putative ankyrin repeat protein RF_0381 isoform X2 [Daphnia magna]|uniref:putative ankyrin repeat protein RF_0381 isoform X2 n=1 Tax=Daphnia magna TaxID=35525 RepID=UPI001E1BCE16|nr:putative ankyrin repeat protein RF_0381 isoform X2 [Daphnia magna]